VTEDLRSHLVGSRLAAVRLVAITELALAEGAELARRLEALLAAAPRGAVLVQVRAKHLDGGPLLALAREVIAVARPAGAPVWVNDRADVARLAGADGVHLPERGLRFDDARRVAPGLPLGASRHAPDAAVAAARDGAALVQLGPIWDVPGKGPPLGPAALGAARAGAHLVAVGGIATPERAHAAAAAGADAIAVIRAAWSDPPRIAELVAAADAGRGAR
jgi:thiamine-phosphate pyrophosphorylase